MNTSESENAFHKFFKLVLADTETLREEVFRIRYEVYCKELHYEDVSNFTDGLEHDSFDERSRHCLLLHRPSNTYAGCVRMVFNEKQVPDQLLPFEKNCGYSLRREAIELAMREREYVGEASRLAVTANFRRRKSDAESPLGEISDAQRSIDEDKRKFSCIAPGLYLAAADIGLRAGLKGVFAMMEPRLVRHLIRFGIHFQQIGDIVDYHGPRAAYYVNLGTLYEGLTPEMKGMFNIIHSDLDGGVTH